MTLRFCSFASGSSGNCYLVKSDNTAILIDAGISGKRILEGLEHTETPREMVSAILVTHEHIDHIQSLLVMTKRIPHVRIYANEATWDQIDRPVPDEHRHLFVTGEEFEIGDLVIKPFPVSHDAAEPVGFRIEHEGKKCAVATDMGCWDDYIREKLKGLDVLLLESNHDVRMLEAGRYPYYLKRRILSDHGHLSNETAGQLLGQLLNESIRHIFLGHLSKENNYEALAFETVSTEVTLGDNPWNSKDFNITIAHRDVPSEAVEW